MKVHLPYFTESVSDDEAVWLKNQLWNGNTEIIERIVLKYIRLSVRTVYNVLRYTGKHSRIEEDDIEGQMYYALVEACMSIKNHEVDQDKPLWEILYAKVHALTKKYIQENHLIRIPNSSYVRSKKDGKEIQTFKQKQLAPVGRSMDTVFELRELIWSCARDTIDREILRLRSYSHTYVEISKLINLSVARINQRLSRIEELYYEKTRILESY